MNRLSRAVGALVCAALLGLGAAACSDSGHGRTSGTAGSDSTRAFTLVALGDEATSLLQSESTIRDSWAQQFFLHTVPRNTTFVNLAQQSATVGSARATQLPVLRGVHPRVVVVLLGLDDARVGERIGMFREEYDGLLADLKAAGVQRILVATLPKAAGAVAGYNDAIRTAARRAGAVVVDLAALPISGSIDTQVGVFVPDAAGQTAVADAFGSAYRGAFPDA